MSTQANSQAAIANNEKLAFIAEEQKKVVQQSSIVNAMPKRKLSPLPAPSHPMVQGTTGLIDPVWYKYLSELRDIVNQ